MNVNETYGHEFCDSALRSTMPLYTGSILIQIPRSMVQIGYTVCDDEGRPLAVARKCMSKLTVKLKTEILWSHINISLWSRPSKSP